MLDACEERAAEEMRRRDALSRLKSGLDACRAVEVAAEADGSGDLGRWFGHQDMVAGLGTCDGLRLEDPAEIKSAAAAAALCLSRCSDLALGAQAVGAALGVIGVSAACDGAPGAVAVESASGAEEVTAIAAAQGASEPVRAQDIAFLRKATELASRGCEFVSLTRDALQLLSTASATSAQLMQAHSAVLSGGSTCLALADEARSMSAGAPEIALRGWPTWSEAA